MRLKGGEEGEEGEGWAGIVAASAERGGPKVTVACCLLLATWFGARQFSNAGREGRRERGGGGGGGVDARGS